MENLREKVQLDLERARGLIEAVHPSPIDTHFRLVMPTGEYWLGITLGDDQKIRDERVGLIGDLFGTRGVYSYTLAVETNSPDGILCVGVQDKSLRVPFGFSEESIDEDYNINFRNDFERMAYNSQDTFALYKTIDRNSLSFSEVTELKKAQTAHLTAQFEIFTSMRKILPRNRRDELERWFGTGGKFPLVPINPN